MEFAYASNLLEFVSYAHYRKHAISPTEVIFDTGASAFCGCRRWVIMFLRALRNHGITADETEAGRRYQMADGSVRAARQSFFVRVADVALDVLDDGPSTGVVPGLWPLSKMEADVTDVHLEEGNSYFMSRRWNGVKIPLNKRGKILTFDLMQALEGQESHVCREACPAVDTQSDRESDSDDGIDIADNLMSAIDLEQKITKEEIERIHKNGAHMQFDKMFQVLSQRLGRPLNLSEMKALQTVFKECTCKQYGKTPPHSKFDGPGHTLDPGRVVRRRQL